MPKCYSDNLLMSEKQNNVLWPCDYDNVDLVHIWTSTCQNAAIPAVNDNISTGCNSS